MEKNTTARPRLKWGASGRHHQSVGRNLNEVPKRKKKEKGRKRLGGRSSNLAGKKALGPGFRH